MKRRACIVVLVAAAACHTSTTSGGETGGPEVPIDAGSVDTPPPIDADAGTPDAPPADAPPTGLTELCGAEAPAPSAPGYVDYWERCYLKRWCEWQVGCSALNPYRDAQDCIDRSDDVVGGALSAELRERTRAIEQHRASIDVAAFTQCLVETSEAYCTTARFSAACATRFTGTIGDGGGCYTDIDCASPGATCESSCSDACCLGTCRPKLTQGQACADDDACEPGLVCHHTCLSGDLGSRCSSDSDCDWSAWCNAGRCAATFPPGSSCTSGFQCGGDTSCIGLSIIDPSPGQCLSISHAGDRCDFLCFGNLYCDGSGICRDLPGLGQSCPGFTPCSGVDTICSNGRCVLRGDAGAACSTTQPCRPGLYCNSELNDPNPTCVAPGGTGQPCADPRHCESYLCSGTTGQPGQCLGWAGTCPAGGG
jgi:hypothetical protein